MRPSPSKNQPAGRSQFREQQVLKGIHALSVMVRPTVQLRPRMLTSCTVVARRAALHTSFHFPAALVITSPLLLRST